jgi:hypothetical protein
MKSVLFGIVLICFSVLMLSSDCIFTPMKITNYQLVDKSDLPFNLSVTLRSNVREFTKNQTIYNFADLLFYTNTHLENSNVYYCNGYIWREDTLLIIITLGVLIWAAFTF